MLTLTCILIKNAFDGRGLLSGSFHESVLSWQILLCIIAVPLILLAALLTERRRTEESLRNTSGKLIYAQEQERQRIARDLHDDISQQLALLQVGIIEVRNEADSTLIPRLNALEDRLSEIFTAVHELSHGLHPSQVIHLGLAAAIKNLIRDTNKKEFLDIEMVEQNVPDNVPPQIGLALFRVTQEALHNIAKHSQAVTGIVELRYSGRDLLLRISDDGVGFYPMQVSGAGLGLESMRERIRSLNGAFVITSAPMHGVTIEAWVPLERKRLQNSGAA
jgi:signal transduction histidine kinase